MVYCGESCGGVTGSWVLLWEVRARFHIFMKLANLKQCVQLIGKAHFLRMECNLEHTLWSFKKADWRRDFARWNLTNLKMELPLFLFILGRKDSTFHLHFTLRGQYSLEPKTSTLTSDLETTSKWWPVQHQMTYFTCLDPCGYSSSPEAKLPQSCKTALKQRT